MHAQASVLLLCTLALLCDARVTKRFDPNHQPYRFVPAENAHHRSVRAPPSTFTVIYNAGAPTNVRNAVDYVLNLLNSWIVFSSAVPIRVNFTWIDLGSTVLGSAGSAWTQQTINRPYPLYIALNNAYYTGGGAGSIDINAQFSSTTPWYIGTDGRPPVSAYDFPTVFLHEMIHGLGFNSRYVALSTPVTGLYNANFPNTAQSSVFDNRLYYGNPATALSTIARNNLQQALLLTACTSQSLFFRTVSAGDVRLFSPATYDSGSSIAHLDPAFYGGADSLMLPSLSNGDAFHYPGLPVLNLLSTIGYTLKPAATVPPTTTVAATVTTGTPPATTPAPGTTVPPATTANTGTPAPTTGTLAPTTGTPAPTTTGTTNPSTTGTTAPPAPTTRQPTASPTTSGQTSPPMPTQTLSAWDGTYAIDSSGCDTLTCCCLTGNAVVTYDKKSNLVTIRSPVIGALCSGTTVELRFGLFGDSDQGGSLLWEGYTYSVSISRVPSVLTVRTTTACGVTATCASGACLAPLVVASASLPTLSLLAALFASAVMLLV